jgi:uncharacterized protein (DUF1501 family)
LDTDRKQFIKSAAGALPILPFIPAALKSSLLEGFSPFQIAPESSVKTLVIIQMAGGNDGLNTVIPYSDSRYYGYRPDIAIAKDKVIPIDSNLGLHPNLQKFKSLWDEKLLAIVQGVGYPNPSYSHFESMRIWQTASPDGSFKDGWLGRYLNTLNLMHSEVFPGLAVGPRTPPELYSEKVQIPVVQSIPAYRFQGDPVYPEVATARLDNVINLYNGSGSSASYLQVLSDTARVASASTQELTTTDQTYQTQVAYPNTSLAKALKILAEAITGNLGVRVCQASVGSFDTHIDEERVQSQLFSELSEGIYAFYQDLKDHGRETEVLIMTWSEFGRRAANNASKGTDHGSAAPMFIIGKAVAGGLYGQPPDLGNLDNGNLRFTTDFRSVYATILEKWLGTAASSVLGDTLYPILDFLV